MNYNIEFQIASILFVSILMIVFYSKKRWSSAANIVFRIIMFLTWLTLALDIASVITITEVVAGKAEFTAINNFLSKFYLVVMAAYIASMDVYVIVNTVYDKISQARMTLKYIEATVCGIALLVAIIVTAFVLKGKKRKEYSDPWCRCRRLRCRSYCRRRPPIRRTGSAEPRPAWPRRRSCPDMPR